VENKKCPLCRPQWEKRLLKLDKEELIEFIKFLDEKHKQRLMAVMANKKKR